MLVIAPRADLLATLRSWYHQSAVKEVWKLCRPAKHQIWQNAASRSNPVTGGMTVIPPVSNTAALRIRDPEKLLFLDGAPCLALWFLTTSSVPVPRECMYISLRNWAADHSSSSNSPSYQPLQSNPHEMSKFTRTINIHRYALNFCGRISSCLTYLLLSKDLGVEATLLLTFDDQPMPGMYQDYFPTAWR